MLSPIFLPAPPYHPSRLVAPPINFKKVVAEQDCCIESQRLLVRTSLTIAFLKQVTNTLVDDVSIAVFQPVVPKKI
jgi:hypothetical protein